MSVQSEAVWELRNKMMTAIAQIMGWYNLTQSESKLYAYMFFEDREMSLEEMKGFMGMSKSSMSYAVRALMDAKMVYKLDYKVNRKELYRADPDFLSSFKNFLTTKLEHEIEVVSASIDDVLPHLRSILDNENTETAIRAMARHDLGKVIHAKNYYIWLRGFVARLKAETISQ